MVAGAKLYFRLFRFVASLPRDDSAHNTEPE